MKLTQVDNDTLAEIYIIVQKYRRELYELVRKYDMSISHASQGLLEGLERRIDREMANRGKGMILEEHLNKVNKPLK